MKSKKYIAIFSLIFLSGLFAMFFQNNISKANSILSPIIVNLLHIDFGVVFPGEQIEKNFLVSYSGVGDGTYKIVEKYRSLPNAEVPSGYVGNISDYCQEYLDDNTRCYQTLCPYIDELSEEGEGDLANSASVDPNDLFDAWTVNFRVPAITGNVVQDNVNGFVTENGIYGCDLSFDVSQICENTPVDVVLVMDRSGSMDLGSCLTADYGLYENVTETWCDLYSGSFTPDDIPSRLAQAQDAAGLFLGKLGDNDHSALVSYASSATLDKGLNDIHLITDGLWSTEIKINELVATGGTNIGEAIERGTIELNNTGRADATKTMILLTDGRPTCPEINSSYFECGYVEDQGDIDYAEEKATEAASAGIKVFTIGLGDEVNTALLTDIASITGAQSYHALNGSVLDDIYSLISEEICL